MTCFRFLLGSVILLGLLNACDLKFQDATTTVVDDRAVQLSKGPGIKRDPSWSPDGRLIVYSKQGTATNLIAKSTTDVDLGMVGRVEENIRGIKVALSPDGDRIVYPSLQRDHLWVRDLHTGDEFQLTSSLRQAREPDWSEDGQWIAFSALTLAGSNPDIWIVPASGGTPRRISSAGLDNFPSWSPDGSRIAFQSWRDGSAAIWIAEVATDSLMRLTSDSVDARAPDWSPDGSAIAYFVPAPDGNSDIWITPPDTSQPVQITSKIVANNPIWSPDGSKIAYRTSGGIWVSDPDGTIAGQTTLQESFPIWLPEECTLLGTVRVVYSNIQLFVLEDSTIVNLTEPVDYQFDQAPTWYPGSRRIAFTRQNAELFQGQTIWTTNIFGGAATPLSGDPGRPGAEFHPDISPDGQWIIYDDGFSLSIIPLPGGEAINLGPFIGIGLEEGNWGPDSQSLVCSSRNGLKVFSTDSTLVIEENLLPGRFAKPSWSREHPVFGTHIAAWGDGGIFVMQTDGSGSWLAIPAGVDPAWSPDGSMLAFSRFDQIFVFPIFREFE